MDPSTPKHASPTTRPMVPWNKGAFVGPKPPLKPKQVWSIRLNLQREGRIRDLALFDLAIDSKLRGCDLVQLRIGQPVINAAARHRATIVQQKTGIAVAKPARHRNNRRETLLTGDPKMGCRAVPACARVFESGQAECKLWDSGDSGMLGSSKGEARLLVTDQDVVDLNAFATGTAKKLGFNSELPSVLWHYTSAPGLLGILESASIFATQLACLNDVSELRYAVSQVRAAMQMLRPRALGEDLDKDFIFDLFDRSLTLDTVPTSNIYVACFSRKRDDLSQWRAYGGGENGYAVALQTQFLLSQHSLVAPVSYDPGLHQVIAGEVASGFVEFFLRGLRRGHDRQEWAVEFVKAWDLAIGHIGPMVKHWAFEAEVEYRCIHRLRPDELKELKFRQKAGMLARHLPLYFPPPARPRNNVLPIFEIMVGPCRHPNVSKASLEALLAQSGYPGVQVTTSAAPFQAV